MKKHVEGKLICIIQLICSITMLGIMILSGMIPTKYILAAGAALLILFAIPFGLQFVRGKSFITGILISIVSSIVIVFIIFWLLKADSAMQKMGGATYKTDNMVVVVRASDPAETLKDAENYRFGKQTAMDQDNTELMVKKINETVGREIKTVDYTTLPTRSGSFERRS